MMEDEITISFRIRRTEFLNILETFDSFKNLEEDKKTLLRSIEAFDGTEEMNRSLYAPKRTLIRKLIRKSINTINAIKRTNEDHRI